MSPEERKELGTRLITEMKAEVALMEKIEAMVDGSMEAHRQMVKNARDTDGTEESDFNRGYYACLVDMKLKLKAME